MRKNPVIGHFEAPYVVEVGETRYEYPVKSRSKESGTPYVHWSFHRGYGSELEAITNGAKAAKFHEFVRVVQKVEFYDDNEGA